MGRRIAHPHLGIAPRRPAPEPNQLADHRCGHRSYSLLKIHSAGLVPRGGARLHPQRLSSLKRIAYSLLKIHFRLWLVPRGGARLHPQRMSSLKRTEQRAAANIAKRMFIEAFPRTPCLIVEAFPRTPCLIVRARLGRALPLRALLQTGHRGGLGRPAR